MAKQKVFLPTIEFEGMYNSLVEGGVMFIDGTNSIYVPSYNTSFVDRDACEEWPNSDGEMILMTPGEAARQTLNLYLNNPKLIAAKRDFKYLDISPPIYYSGRKFDQYLWYIDLRSAYAQIYKYMSLDIRWPRGQGELMLYEVANRLAQWKKARNAVIGISRMYTTTNVKGKDVWQQRTRNPFFNPHVWFHVQSTLHQLAGIAVDWYDCQYVGTDCYIFHKQRNFERFRDYLESVQFEFTTIEGNGYLYGFHSYKVGTKATKHYRRRTSFHSNLENSRGMIEWRLKVKKSID